MPTKVMEYSTNDANSMEDIAIEDHSPDKTIFVD